MIPDVQASDWPMVSPSQKGESTNIVDGDGAVVGRLAVWREDLWEGDGYATGSRAPSITPKATLEALRGLGGAARRAALDLIRDRKNWVKERADNRGDAGEDGVVAAIKDLLRAKGVIKGKKVKT